MDDLREIVDEIWIWLKEDESGPWKVVSSIGHNPIILAVLPENEVEEPTHYEILVTKKP